MICSACARSSCTLCDDRRRQARFDKWVMNTYSSRPMTEEDERIIRISTPYPSCDCQHRVLCT